MFQNDGTERDIFLSQNFSEFSVKFSKCLNNIVAYTKQFCCIVLAIDLVSEYDRVRNIFGVFNIIVPLDTAPEVVEAITGLGFLVNKRKSFFDGVTRESCGAFMVAGVEVTRYDIKYA